MKSNWIPMKSSNTRQTNRSELVRKIQELIDWYDDNSTRKEDDYIKANLKLVIHLAENIEHSEDIIFIEKIIDTFSDIIKKQRKVIQTLEDESVFQPFSAPTQHNYLSSYVAPPEGFINDDQIKAAFDAYMKEEGKSSFTTNDYILRVQNLWRSFYSDYKSGELPNELAELVIKEEIYSESPLLNAYNHIEELNCYVSMKVASSGENRNWTNIRAALNTFGKALYKDEYEKVKPERNQSQSKDFSKYLFEGMTYGKSRLVLAVVQRYVEDYHPATFDELEKAFPNTLQGSLGVVKRIEDVSDKYKGNGGVKRYFIKENEIIHLNSDEQVIVCTQWGASNTEKFVEHAVNNFGYSIEKV